MEMIVFSFSPSNYHKPSKYNLLCWQQISSNILFFSQVPASTSLLRLTSSSPGYDDHVRNDDKFAMYCLCETVCVLERFVSI